MERITSISNFRDLAGNKTKYNEQIQPFKLLRSGELYQVSAADKQLLETTYQLQLVIDLRSESEAQQRPDDLTAGSRYLHLDVMKDFNVAHTGLENLILQAKAHVVDEEMLTVYQKLILDRTAQLGFQKLIVEIAGLNAGSALFHCFAGKDRTGIAAALLLEILEVHRDDIFQDYLQTNVLRTAANTAILAHAKEKGLADPELEMLNQLLLVKESYLQVIYDTMHNHYGGVQEYLTSGLGITDEIRDQLKQHCLG